MKPTDEQHPSQDAEWSPNLTINHIPDELLLEIFDSYRQAIDHYDQEWSREYVWFNLAHVCRKWAPDITGIALLRMRAVLMHHHDHVRKISFGGTRANFDEFFNSLSLDFYDGYEPKIPDTFLRGPDLSDLHLRRLSFHGSVSLASVSGFLLSSSEATLLTCLQGLPCLRHFDLFISLLRPLNSPSQSSTTKDIVLLSKLTCLYYIGPGVLLDALVAGLSAPSLHDANIHFSDTTLPPIVHLPRFINEIEERYYAVHVSFQGSFFRLSFLTQSESIGHCYPHFTLSLDMSYNQETITRQEKIMRISGALSTRLTIMEELRVTFDRTNAIFWEDLFYDQGPDNYLTFLPALEEMELSHGFELAAFESFISARQQVGRPVKVFFGP
ncbi:hypothetical protein BJV77DRAFT_995298 [Russula vinacea]|nr:hypothetical protein BJV77DRAFT_995298 [Russula vinacea]